ncbi:MAG: gamma-glutamylcyclotransferase family protein [Alphaproteobacteria bacterium]|nr:gamma-glutamylcyclotransferase family protein [Alphaproteobacteria bacterium]
MKFFFYGTLMDAELLQTVLGRVLAAEACLPMNLAGFRRHGVRGRTYPILVPAAAGVVRGIMAQGLAEADALRLTWYESDDYEIRECRLRGAGGARATAWVYLPRPGIMVAEGGWDFQAWRRRHKAEALRRLAGGLAGPTPTERAEARACWDRRKPL